jgi:1-acyl-sn-glycerol-3-phosphate acyltransferase
MIKQIIATIFIILWTIFSTYGFITPFLIINQEKMFVETLKNSFQILVSYVLKYGFGINLKCNMNITQTKNKIDILISNHVATVDSFILLSMLEQMNISNFIMVGKKDLIYTPGIGMLIMFGDHIKLARNWEEDKYTIDKQLENIKEGIIVLFPEGTRYTEEKFKEAQEFSKKNNLPVYDNLLVPKSKGFEAIYNNLKINNKLGNIYDSTMILENTNLFDLFKKDSTNVHLINRILNKEELENKDFKSWLLEKWSEKDNIIKTYSKIKYENMYPEIDENLLFLNLFIYYNVFILLIENKEFRYYFLTLIVISYVITYMKRNQFGKKVE